MPSQGDLRASHIYVQSHWNSIMVFVWVPSLELLGTTGCNDVAWGQSIAVFVVVKEISWRSVCPLPFPLIPNTTFSQLYSLSPECSISRDCVFSFHQPLPSSFLPPSNFFLGPGTESFPREPLVPNHLLPSSEQKPKASGSSSWFKMAHCASIPQAALSIEGSMCVMRNGTQWLAHLEAASFSLSYFIHQQPEGWNFVPTKICKEIYSPLIQQSRGKTKKQNSL